MTNPTSIAGVLAHLDTERQGATPEYHEGVTYAMSLLENLPADGVSYVDRPTYTALEAHAQAVEVELAGAKRRARELAADVTALQNQKQHAAEDAARHHTALVAERVAHNETRTERGDLVIRLRKAEDERVKTTDLADMLVTRANRFADQALDLTGRLREALAAVAHEREAAAIYKAERDQLAERVAEQVAEPVDTTDAGLVARLLSEVARVTAERDDARKAAREGDQHLADLAALRAGLDALTKPPTRGPLLGYGVNSDGSTGDPIYATPDGWVTT